MSDRLRRFVLSVLVPFPAMPERWRVGLLRWCGVQVGSRARVRGRVFFTSADVALHEDTFINFDCIVDALWAPVVLEPGVALGPGCRVLTATHEIGDPSRRHGRGHGLPVRIGAGTWVGACATILPGVTIGSGCVIAAGSLVRRDCDPNGLYVGVPARRLRDLDPAAQTPAAADAQRP